jgi:hypothetical protein
MRRTAHGAGENECYLFLIFFALSRETVERSKATPLELAKSRPTGRDDALMVDQGAIL